MYMLHSEQECIPVGCVPPAAVAVSPAKHVPPHPLPRTPPPCTPPAVDRHTPVKTLSSQTLFAGGNKFEQA